MYIVKDLIIKINSDLQTKKHARTYDIFLA